jgi:hypothetical protein
MNAISFEERVRNAAIQYAKDYDETFVQHEYLVISDAFRTGYHIIHAQQDNYAHLLGIQTDMSKRQFFSKCLDQSLSVNDFQLKRAGYSRGSVKGSVRDKLAAMPDFLSIFSKDTLYCQEDFRKGKVYCAFASSDGTFTAGFITEGNPKSLMKNNQLDMGQARPVAAVLRKQRGESEFHEVIMGDISSSQKIINKVNQLSGPSDL